MAGKYLKKGFKFLTAFVMGGAIGSILGLTLAPKKGKETREYIRDQSMKMFLEGKNILDDQLTPEFQGKKMGFFKRFLLKILKPKKK